MSRALLGMVPGLIGIPGADVRTSWGTSAGSTRVGVDSTSLSPAVESTLPTLAASGTARGVDGAGDETGLVATGAAAAVVVLTGRARGGAALETGGTGGRSAEVSADVRRAISVDL